VRYINKTQEPGKLTAFKRRQKGKNYADIDNDLKTYIRTALVHEQYYLCAYCMRRIDPENSHIEHIKPQSKFPKDSLKYENMLLCCNTKNTCGHSKKDWWDSEMYVSPLDITCESEFAYIADGTIRARSPKGMKMVEILNLNAYRLKMERKKAILGSGFYSDEYTEKKNEWLKLYLEPDVDGRLIPFCKAVEWLFVNR
jgi:uncharacterized protein (TIGR02646 family)